MHHKDIQPGAEFERLRVEEFVAMTIKGRRKKWRCSCWCGNEVVVAGEDLARGDTKSCGCLRDERTRESHNTRRGNLSGLALRHGGHVVGPTNKYTVRKNGDRYPLWKCVCPCGNEFLATATKIVHGRRSFCGLECPKSTSVRRVRHRIDYAAVRVALARANGHKLVDNETKARVALAAGRGDRRAQELLIMLYDRWVVQRANVYARSHRLKGDLVVEELVQEGRIALIKAAERWEPERGAFTTCAAWWLLHAMGREPNSGTSNIELPANAFRGKRTRTAAMLALRSSSIDAPIGGDDSELTLGDTLEAKHDEPEFGADVIAKIPLLLDAVRPKHRPIIEACLLGERTMADVGVERGLTRERIRQIVAAGIEQMRVRAKVLRMV